MYQPRKPSKRRRGSTIKVRVWNNHSHGRRGRQMNVLLPILEERVGGASFEPNTHPHLYTYDDVARYYDRAHEIAPRRHWRASFYITPKTRFKDVERAYREKKITHAKEYPGGVTTHSTEGVKTSDVLNKNSKIGKLYCAFSEAGIPVKGHKEVLRWEGRLVNAEERERIVVREILPRELDLYPNLRRINAHISTWEMVEFMWKVGDPHNFIAELTSHHGYFDDTIFFEGGNVLPNHHCNPKIKQFKDNAALRQLVSAEPKWLVFGPDDASHLRFNKECFRCMGGLWTYHCSTELAIQLLDEEGVLDYADDFFFGNAKRFHGDQIPDDLPYIEFKKESWKVNERLRTSAGIMTPFGYDPVEANRFEFMWKRVA